MSDRFRDPFGWFMDALPWRLRKYLIAYRMKERPSEIPDSVRVIGWRKPPRYVFEYFRRLYGLDRLASRRDASDSPVGEGERTE